MPGELDAPSTPVDGERRGTHTQATDHAPIDPALYASSALPPRTQAYPQTPQPAYAQTQHGTAAHPYYLPTSASAHQQPPPLANSLLHHTSPIGPGASPDDDDHDDHDDGGGDHDGTHATPGSAKSPGDFKRPRACDSCRGLKVRCDQERPDVSCRRCAKAGRPWYVCAWPKSRRCS